MRFAVGMLANRSVKKDRFITDQFWNHSVAFLQAENLDEAHGKAMRMAMNVYPGKEGWKDHTVCVIPGDSSDIDPDRAMGIRVE